MTRALRLPVGGAIRRSSPRSAGPGAALGVAVGQQLGGGLRRVGTEVAHWRRQARLIPDPVLRGDALASLREKRSYVNGAALFASVSVGARAADVQRLLATFQIMANYLDTVSERAAASGGATDGGLTRAFVDAVDPGEPPRRGYYAGLERSDDGGYLAALVSACRDGCQALPRHAAARTLLVREAERARALEITHDPDTRRRDDRLRAFAESEYPGDDDLAWFEHAAGAASAMTVIVLLALAARPLGPDATPAAVTRDLAVAAAAYRSTAALSTILDSYVDRAEDLASGDWSMVGYYPSAAGRQERISAVIERSMAGVRGLDDGARHAVIVGSMIAMFLSRDSARDPELRRCSQDLARAGGRLTQTLVPVLRTWRTVYRLRAL